MCATHQSRWPACVVEQQADVDDGASQVLEWFVISNLLIKSERFLEGFRGWRMGDPASGSLAPRCRSWLRTSGSSKPRQESALSRNLCSPMQGANGKNNVGPRRATHDSSRFVGLWALRPSIGTFPIELPGKMTLTPNDLFSGSTSKKIVVMWAQSRIRARPDDRSHNVCDRSQS